MSSERPLAAWYFFYFAFVGAFAPYASLYFQSLDISPARIAVLLTLGQAMRLVAPAGWGWLADRAGQRAPVVRYTAAAAAGCYLLYFVTTDFHGLLVATALLHFFWSAGLPLVEALTLGHLQAAVERYSRIRLWGSVGFIAAVTGVGALLDHVPISALIWVGTALLLGTLVCARWLGDAQASGGGGRHPAWRPFDRTGWILFGSAFLMAAAHGPFYVFFTIHLDNLGYAKGTIGLLWALGVVAEIAVFAFAPRWLRHGNLRSLLLLCFALASVRFLLTGWAAQFLLMLLLAQMLHGFTFGAHHAAMVAALGRCYPAAHQASVQAWYGSVSFGAGGMAGGLLAGQLWQPAGAGISFSVAALFAAAGMVVVAGLGSLPPSAVAERVR